MAKKNKDGIEGGSLVTPEQHLAVMNKKRAESRKVKKELPKETE